MHINKILLISIPVLLICCKNNSNLSDAYGNFEAEEVIISSESNGELMYFPVTEGQELDKGEMTAIIDTTQLAIKYKQAEAQLYAAKIKLTNLDKQKDILLIRIRILEKEKARLENLLKNDAATQKQYDDVAGNMDVLKEKVESVELQKKTANAELDVLLKNLELIRYQLDKCIIKAPLSGTVLETYVQQHELVVMGKSIIKMANLNEMILRVYVSGAQLSSVKLRQMVTVFVDKNKKENYAFDGTVIWISDKAEFTPKIIQTKEERVNLVYAVKVSVKNDGTIKTGMPGEVAFK